MAKVELSVKEKAKMFDWIASRVDEAKFQLNFGGSDWIYPNCDPECFVAEVRQSMTFEEEAEDD